MNDVLSGLIGRMVQVYSVRGETEVSDTGVLEAYLEAYDDTWRCLSRGGDKLYFSIARVRLIKPL